MELSSLLGTLFGLVFCAGILALGIVGAVRAQKRAAERKAGMAGYATHREWEYRPSDDSLVTRFGGAPFDRGYSRSATNVLLGKHDGRHFVAFDYAYVTSSGTGSDRSTQHHHYSVLALNLGLPTPGLAVGPTSTFGRLVNAVTGRDVQIGNPFFDEAFTVTSPSPEFALDVLHPAVVEVVMHHPELAWRLEGDSMLVIREGQHSPQEIEAKLHFMDAVLDRIPEHVRARLIGEQPR
ncbi:hypothetical protein [Nocardioides antri]|uniref:DUF3137 domain-containing protein n=1 Tax=Nocardioides antri TaxID=2607659 RepID=A0A5B1M8K3_9ACTN|nr:hypothetical protein [Nocardioides antri]KAA1429211.1 hypothetical protein F0U47_03195 [Nocardioides antri]